MLNKTSIKLILFIIANFYSLLDEITLYIQLIKTFAIEDTISNFKC